MSGDTRLGKLPATRLGSTRTKSNRCQFGRQPGSFTALFSLKGNILQDGLDKTIVSVVPIDDGDRKTIQPHQGRERCRRRRQQPSAQRLFRLAVSQRLDLHVAQVAAGSRKPPQSTVPPLSRYISTRSASSICRKLAIPIRPAERKNPIRTHVTAYTVAPSSTMTRSEGRCHAN
jgi:hypothetical protein